MRKTGIDVLGDAPWGTHLCLFYQTKKDLIDILVPYFKAGLENNEFCLWITSETITGKDAEKAMKKTMPDFDRYLKRGQIEILPHTQWYLKDGVFDPQRIFKAGGKKLNQALSQGYDGLRASGDTAWLKKKGWQSFIDYEKEANKTVGKYPVLGLCSYPLDKCGAAEVIDVVSHHGFALIKRHGRWEVIESSEHRQAEELRKAKIQQNFFIDLAHELKTPLTIMKASLDLALGKNGEKIRKNFESFTHFHEAQKEEVDRVDKIINDLSTLAKADTKQLSLRFGKVKLDKLLERACLRLQTVAKGEKKKLLVKKLAPLTVRGDQERLEQLVSNLLDNAVKFTKRGSGRILVSLTKDRGRAKIRIKDNGIGIPKKDLPHVFERFHRGANTKRKPNLRGSGLGLAICDWIVKEHHGKITVESTNGKGTVFTVFLPHDPKSLIKI